MCTNIITCRVAGCFPEKWRWYSIEQTCQEAVIRIGYCALRKQLPLPFRKRYCENPVQMCLYKYFRLKEFLRVNHLTGMR